MQLELKVVYADRREHPAIRPELVRFAPKFNVAVKVAQLESGDYAFLDADGRSVGVERKWFHSDLLRDLRSGQLEVALTKCLEAYDKAVWLVHGTPTAEPDGKLRVVGCLEAGKPWDTVDENSKYSDMKALEASVQAHGIDIIWAASSFRDVALSVLGLYKWCQNTSRKFMRRYIRPKPSIYVVDPREAALLDLWPRLPEPVAHTLIERYSSVWAVLQAPKQELMEVPGLGKGLVALLDRRLGR
jgi:ERCC4-type nuclease